MFRLAHPGGGRWQPGFQAIGDWLKTYQVELVALFQPPKGRLPSYSTIRRVLLGTEYAAYSACLSGVFGIQPLAPEPVALDGKSLRGSYEAISDDPRVESHPAIMLVSAYLVERGLILEPYEVSSRTNEITAIPAFIHQMAVQGGSLPSMRLAPKKTAQTMLESENDYLGALKGNQSGLLEAVKPHFQPHQSDCQLNKGHGRIEERTVSITHKLDGIPDFPGLQTLIRVESERQVHRATIIEVSTETRYCGASFRDTAPACAERIRGYWGVENKVHYVRDLTQAEDASRIRTSPLIQSWAIARNFALNLYRDHGFEHVAQAQSMAGFGLSTLKQLFRMK